VFEQKKTIMKKTIIALPFIFLGVCLLAQNRTDYTQEMINSEESFEKEVHPDRPSSFNNDYEAFIRAKAWRSSSVDIFTNSSDLDIEGIGGRVRAVLVDKDNNIALVAPSGGGLWKFDPDNGDPFVPVDDFGSFMAISDINQDPNNKQHIIISTGADLHNIKGNGLFESMDGGSTFSQITSTKPSANSDFNYIRYVKFSPKTPNTIYMTTGVKYSEGTGKVYKSTNGGTSWTKVLDVTGSNYAGIKSLDFLPNKGVIVSVYGKGLYSSTTGNSGTFSIISSTLPNDNSGSATGTASVNGNVVATHAANRNIVYAFFAKSQTDNATYKSTNGGVSWTKVIHPNINKTLEKLVALRQLNTNLVLGVHPTNPDILIVGSVSWGYSKDGGATWKKGNLEVDYHSIDFDESRPNIAYLGYDQGVGKVDFNKSDNSWQFAQEIGKSAGFNSTQIYYGDYYPESEGDAFLSGQQDGGSFARIGSTQRRVVVGDGGSAFINKQDPSQAWVSTQRGRLYKTTNGLAPSPSDFQNGEITWITSGEYDSDFITQFQGNDADGNQLYLVDDKNVRMTKDGGATFNSIAPHTFSQRISVAVEDAVNPTVYTTGIYWSWNSDLIRVGNATSSSPTIKTHVNILESSIDDAPERITVDPNDKNSVYITAMLGTAYKFSDLNTNTFTKTSIKGNIPDVIFNIVIGVKNKPNLLIAGTNIGVFYSQDAGVTWVLSSVFPYTQVTHLRFRDSDQRLFVFTYGRGAWAATLDILAGMDSQKEIKMVIYPNPASDFIKVQLEGEESTIIDLVLYNEEGKKVAVSYQSNIMNVSELAKGVYILHAKSKGDLIAMQQIIID